MRIAPPGRMVNGLHVWASGHGKPVVVLEAGIAASSVSWSLVQPRVAEFTRVLSYDRAGFGWSAAGSGGGTARNRAGTAANAAGDLKRMLEESREPGPYVLVGHSFGGLIVRVFQQLYPERVAGLVLVDPVLRSDWRVPTEARRRMLGRGVILSRRGALLARMGVVRVALKLLMSGSRRIPRAMARVFAGNGAGNGASVTGRLAGEVRKMPREHWPAIAQHWSEARSFRAMADNLENLPLSAAQLDENAGLADLPVTVLSPPNAAAEHLHDARLSSAGEHVIAPESGHWMQLDAPDAVVAAIARVVAQVRTR
jgi:pimeloyl-ACP methyl ester carboxylesterase